MGHHHQPGCGCVNSILTRLDHGQTNSDPCQRLTPKRLSPDASGETKYFVAEKIYTLEPGKEEAKAVKVKGEMIADVYTHGEWRALIQGPDREFVNARTVALPGYLYPGFHECHMHALLDGLLMAGSNLRDVYDEDAMVTVLREQLQRHLQVKQGKTLVMGYNVDPLSQNPITTDTWLTVLDRVSSVKGVDPEETYVLVEHNSMHIWYVNTTLYKAIEAHDPEAASNPTYFPRDANGNPTGVVQEDEGIQALLGTLTVLELLPSNPSILQKAATAIGTQARLRGCTTITDAMLGTIDGDLNAYVAVSDDDKPLSSFPVRIVVHPFYSSDFAQKCLRKHADWANADINKRLKVGGVKYVIDGSLQGGTAYNPPYTEAGFQKYFSGDPEGVLNMDKDTLKENLAAFKAGGFQPMIHANSTAAIQIALEALSETFDDEELQTRRPRIEHCQVASKRQLDFMAKKGIMPNFLVNHVFYWGEIYNNELLPPTVAQSISPCRSALARGLKPAIHSDAYVSPLDPLRLIWTAVNRVTGYHGKPTDNVLNPEECISVKEALEAVTINAARFTFEEDIKGSIRRGKLADFTLLGEDLFAIDPMDILGVPVRGTVLGGTYLPVPEA